MPAPLAAEPTAGVVLATRFIPNCFVPVVETVGTVRAVIVFAPEVKVVPLTVIEYPLEAFVEALIVEVPETVELELSVPRGTAVLASVNVRASSTEAVTVTAPAVDVATVPVSIAVVQAASEYEVIRKK